MRAPFLQVVLTLVSTVALASSPALAAQTDAFSPADTPADATTTTQAPLKIGGGVLPPSLLHSVPPQFSDQARKTKFGGTVIVGLIVDAKGLPQNIHIIRGVGMGLDEKALDAVKQYTFKPATLHGKPVPVAMNIQVNFQINKGPAEPNYQ